MDEKYLKSVKRDRFIVVVLMVVQVLIFASGIYQLTSDKPLVVWIGVFNVVTNPIFFFVNIESFKNFSEVVKYYTK